MPQRDKRGRLVCWCGGYWFPHRKGGGACEHSKTCNIHRAKRTGDAELIAEAWLDYIWTHGGIKCGPNDPIPF